MTEPVPGPPTPTSPAPPAPAAPSRTPVLVAVAAVVVAVVIAGIVLVSGDDGGDENADRSEGISSSSTVSPDVDTGAGESSTIDAEDAPVIEVTGDPLPTGADDGEDDPARGQQLPAIGGVGYDGRPVQLSGSGARLIVVMAHWCPHCQREVPRLVEWAADGVIPDDVALLGVSTAVAEERGNFPPASWLAREGFDFPVLADDAETSALRALGVEGFPTFVAVDADGRVAARMSGEIEREQFDELIDAARTGAPR